MTKSPSPSGNRHLGPGNALNAFLEIDFLPNRKGSPFEMGHIERMLGWTSGSSRSGRTGRTTGCATRPTRAGGL